MGTNIFLNAKPGDSVFPSLKSPKANSKAKLETGIILTVAKTQYSQCLHFTDVMFKNY